MAPSDLPLSEITHLKYAFAYIKPKKTYEVEIMGYQRLKDCLHSLWICEELQFRFESVAKSIG
jgi:GH18 family chitinase